MTHHRSRGSYCSALLVCICVSRRSNHSISRPDPSSLPQHRSTHSMSRSTMTSSPTPHKSTQPPAYPLPQALLMSSMTIPYGLRYKLAPRLVRWRAEWVGLFVTAVLRDARGPFFALPYRSGRGLVDFATLERETSGVLGRTRVFCLLVGGASVVATKIQIRRAGLRPQAAGVQSRCHNSARLWGLTSICLRSYDGQESHEYNSEGEAGFLELHTVRCARTLRSDKQCRSMLDGWYD
jgi:hypothetical protein